MFGFERYCAAFLVKGEKTALIDTGLSNQLDALNSGMKDNRVFPKDTTHIFITHSHLDHIGIVNPFLNRTPKPRFMFVLSASLT